MKHLGGAPGPLGEVHLLEHIEHLQGGDALAIGRQLVKVIAAVVHAGRLHPVAGMGGEVLVAEVRADTLEVCRHIPGYITAIERVAAAPAYRLKRVAKVGVAEHFSRPWGAPPGIPGAVNVFH